MFFVVFRKYSCVCLPNFVSLYVSLGRPGDIDIVARCNCKIHDLIIIKQTKKHCHTKHLQVRISFCLVLTLLLSSYYSGEKEFQSRDSYSFIWRCHKHIKNNIQFSHDLALFCRSVLFHYHFVRSFIRL